MKTLITVHHADAAGLVLHALRADQVHVPLDVVAPEAVQIKVFARKLGAILERPSWLGLPAFVVRLERGDVANALLRGANIHPPVGRETGYEFLFPKLEVALDGLLVARDSRRLSRS